MPYVSTWVPPELFLEYKGVKVYHAYKGERALHFWFTLSPELNAPAFDIRELSSWPKAVITRELKRGRKPSFEFDLDRKAPLRVAIGSGEIHRAKTLPMES